MARRPASRLERRAAHAGGHLRPASAPRLDNAAPAQHIGDRRPQPLRIVVEQPERDVAVVAEEPAHFLGRVAMIDAEPPRRSSLADGAEAALLDQHPLQVIQAEAECPDAPRPPLFAPQLVEPVAVLRVVGAVCGKLSLSIARIPGISLPVLLIAESHRASPKFHASWIARRRSRQAKASGVAVRESRTRAESLIAVLSGSISARRSRAGQGETRRRNGRRPPPRRHKPCRWAPQPSRRSCRVCLQYTRFV